jgi:predicted RecA/RadA family phage recombinase
MTDTTAYGPTPSVGSLNQQAEQLDGYHTMPYTNAGATDIAAGDIVVVNGLPGRAVGDIPVGKSGTLVNLTTVNVVKKYEAIAQGAKVYWDTTGDPYTGTAGTGAATGTAASHYLMGRAQVAALIGDARVKVLLMPMMATESAVGYSTLGNLLSTAAGEQDTFEAVALANKAYEFGTIRTTAEGDEFVYAYADTGGVQTEFGAVNPIASIAGAVAPAQATDAGDVGDKAVTFTVAASGTGVSGAAGNGAVAINELVGGMVWIGNGSGQHPQCRKITSNTAVVAGGGACTCTFDNPLTAAVSVGVTNIEVSANPYRYTQSANVANSAYMSVVGIPAVTCAAGYCYWLRRKGMVWVTSDNNTGKAANGRDAFFQTNGSIVTASSTTYTCRQRAGYTLDLSASGASNAPNLMLQL